MSAGAKTIFFTDGGGERNDGAAAAAIIEDGDSKVRWKIAAYLGGATNNEAEIFGGLLAFSFLQRSRFLRGDADGRPFVRWVCDSEYTLKSGTGYIHAWQRNGWRTAAKAPVKNQGLWRAYLHVSTGIQISPEHVRGHSGHPENEECDEVCTLVRRLGTEATSASSDLLAGWHVVDARGVLEELRVDEPSEEAFEALLALIPDSALGSSGAARSEGAQGGSSEKRDELKDLRKKLSELVQILERLEGHSEPLVQHLLQVIRARGPF